MADGACWRCKFFNHLAPEEVVSEETGECRRYPPQAMDDGEGNLYAQFPPTGWTEWCGEYKEQE